MFPAGPTDYPNEKGRLASNRDRIEIGDLAWPSTSGCGTWSLDGTRCLRCDVCQVHKQRIGRCGRVQCRGWSQRLAADDSILKTANITTVFFVLSEKAIGCTPRRHHVQTNDLGQHVANLLQGLIRHYECRNRGTELCRTLGQ